MESPLPGERVWSPREMLLLSALGVLYLVVAGTRLLGPERHHVGLYHDDGIYTVTAKSLAEGKGLRIARPDQEPCDAKTGASRLDAFRSGLSLLLSLATVGLLVSTLRRPERMIYLYVLLFWAVMVLWPWPHPRLAIPVIPFCTVVLLDGMRRGYLRIKERSPAWSSSLAIGMLAVLGVLGRHGLEREEGRAGALQDPAALA